MSDVLDYSEPWEEETSRPNFPPRLEIPDDARMHVEDREYEGPHRKVISNGYRLWIPDTWGKGGP